MQDKEAVVGVWKSDRVVENLPSLLPRVAICSLLLKMFTGAATERGKVGGGGGGCRPFEKVKIVK